MLRGEIRPAKDCGDAELCAMYRLMEEFYDGTDEAVFRRDFAGKDFCLSLYAEDGSLAGFTTQKILAVDVDGRRVEGVFSGDTIIHRKYWGDQTLFKVWADFWFRYAGAKKEFYWFLICKGYKTYRMLPVFFKHFYPDCRRETPSFEKSIMDAYGSFLYPGEYNPFTGVIEYRADKDRLRQGVADIGERELKNRDIAFFAEKNPGYLRGNDLACLARIDRENLRPHAAKFLFS